MHDTVYESLAAEIEDNNLDEVRYEPFGIWSDEVAHFTTLKSVQKSWDLHGLAYEILYRRAKA